MKLSLLLLLLPISAQAMMAETPDLRYSPHALERMKERCLPESMIERTINNGKKKVTKNERLKFTLKDLIVITNFEKTDVITVYSKDEAFNLILKRTKRAQFQGEGFINKVTKEVDKKNDIKRAQDRDRKRNI